MTEIKFGCFLPQESADFKQLIEVADECERLGYDSIWAYDHLSPFWVHSGQALECWTALAAVAEHTKRIRIGSLAGTTNYPMRLIGPAPNKHLTHLFGLAENTPRS